MSALTPQSTMDPIRTECVANESFPIVESRAIQCLRPYKTEYRTECAIRETDRRCLEAEHLAFVADSAWTDVLALKWWLGPLTLPHLDCRKRTQNLDCI